MTQPTSTCADCGRRGVRLRGRIDNGGRVCSNCCAIRRSVTCASCGEHARINGRDRDGQPLCQRCRLRVLRHGQDIAARERIITAVAAADPTLNRAVIGAVLTSITEHARSLRRIARHLDAHPDVFTTGPTDRPVCSLPMRGRSGSGAVGWTRSAMPDAAMSGCGGWASCSSLAISCRS